MFKMKLGLLSIALLCTTTFIMAQEKEEVPVPESIQKLKLASESAVYGYQNNSVLSLIHAADLYLSTSLIDFKAEKVEQGEGEKTSKTETVSFDVEKILKDAKALAALEGDKDIYLKLIANLEKKSVDRTRSPVGGTQRAYGTVYAFSKNTYTVTLKAFERTYIEVYGDGDTDLDLYVYDAYGNFIVSDTRYSPNAAVWVVPNVTATFSLVVKNNGSVYNNFMIVAY